jgi:membrane protein DedA with SNARE-associated domain
MSDILDLGAIEAFIRAHHVWAGVIVGVLCFLESVVLISLFVPATALLLAVGGLVGAGIIGWVDIFIGGVVGCLLGDTVSYWIGRRLGPHADKVWPFSTRRHMLEKGEAFFAKNGWWGVFVGRFFGPLRAIVPTCAGIMGMPHLAFQAVSVASAIVFVPVVVAPGAILVAGAEGARTGQIVAALPMILLMGIPLVIAAVWAWNYKKRHAAEMPDEGPPQR